MKISGSLKIIIVYVAIMIVLCLFGDMILFHKEYKALKNAEILVDHITEVNVGFITYRLPVGEFEFIVWNKDQWSLHGYDDCILSCRTSSRPLSPFHFGQVETMERRIGRKLNSIVIEHGYELDYPIDRNKKLKELSDSLCGE